MVEGKKIHNSSSNFLDNFYSKLPSRYPCPWEMFVHTQLFIRPTQSSLVALHRPESCRSQRRLSGWYGEGRSAFSNPLSSRPSSSLSRSASHNDVSRPSSSLLTSSSHDRTVTNSGRPRYYQTLSPLNLQVMSRSSLRRTMSNTHLINGFYDSKNNGETNNYYLHGPYYENPDTSPYRADGPRIYKSDRHSFFNGKIFTVRDIPKYSQRYCYYPSSSSFSTSDLLHGDQQVLPRPDHCSSLQSQQWQTSTIDSWMIGKWRPRYCFNDYVILQEVSEL